MYVECEFEIKSLCKYYHPTFAHRDNKFIKVQALLIHSIIIIAHDDQLDEPYETICLEGLAVDIVDTKDQGHGIAITHRDGLYSKR